MTNEWTNPEHAQAYLGGNEYLESTEIIDWKESRIVALANELTGDATDQLSVAQAVFEWVRDKVQHSVDFKRCEVTCRASDVLKTRTGFCYSKSHLVAALMRANGIPTGVCYQRLSINGDGPPYCLHGLNAVFLDGYGWYRIDARGNSKTTKAAFSPPEETLAFSIKVEGEADLPEIWPSPLPVVVAALFAAESVEEFQRRLPDVPLIQAKGAGIFVAREHR